MKKRVSVVLAIALSLSTIMGGCTAKETSVQQTGPTEQKVEDNKTGETKPTYKTLKVGMMPYTVNVPAQYAFDKGWFKEAGLDVEFVTFQTGVPMNEALAAKKLDMGVAGTAAVFSLVNDITTLVYECNTAGGMGVYVRKDSPIAQIKGQLPDKPNVLGSAETIKGIKVLGALGTVSQYATIKYAESFGLKETDIQQIHMEFAQALQAFKAGEGDAVSVPPPFSFQAEADGAVRAVSFEEAAGLSMKDGIIVRKDILKDRRDEIVLFVQVYERACKELIDNVEERHSYSKTFFGANGFEYTDQMMTDEIAVRDYIDKEFISKPDYVFGNSYLTLAEFFTSAGKIEEELLPNMQNAIDTSILEEAFGLKVKKVN